MVTAETEHERGWSPLSEYKSQNQPQARVPAAPVPAAVAYFLLPLCSSEGPQSDLHVYSWCLHHVSGLICHHQYRILTQLSAASWFEPFMCCKYFVNFSF